MHSCTDDLLRLIAELFRDPGSLRDGIKHTLAGAPEIVDEVVAFLFVLYHRYGCTVRRHHAEKRYLPTNIDLIAEHSDLLVYVHRLRAANDRQAAFTAHLIPFHALKWERLEASVRVQHTDLINKDQRIRREGLFPILLFKVKTNTHIGINLPAVLTQPPISSTRHIEGFARALRANDQMKSIGIIAILIDVGDRNAKSYNEQ